MRPIRRRVFRRRFTYQPTNANTPRTKRISKFYGEYRSIDGSIRRIPLHERHADSTAALDALIASVLRLSAGTATDPDSLPEPARKAYEHELRIAHTLTQQQHGRQDNASIASLIARWKASLIARGVTEKHAHTITTRAEQAFADSSITVFAHVTAAAVEQHQGRLRKKKRGVQTCNHYLQACKQFCGWMIDNGLATVNPLARLRMQNVAAGRKHERRALTTDELETLIATATTEPHRYNMTGPARALLYRTAVETGLRANELRHVTANDIELATPTPHIRIPAQRSKRRQEERQPITQSLARAIADHIATLATNTTPLFTMPNAGNVSRMLRRDLTAAKIKHKDSHGKVIDFHALRHTYITSLVRNGMNPKHVQRLARHSTITLTLDRYTHADDELHAELETAIGDGQKDGQIAAKPRVRGRNRMSQSVC